MKKDFQLSVLLFVAAAALAVPSIARAEPDAFVDELITVNGSLDIGERTAFSPLGPPIPPTAAQNGPITAGTVKGQFEFTCGVGNTPADCPDADYAAGILNWRWGVLQVTGGSPPALNASFLEVAGKNLFDSDLAMFEGFTSVETQGFDGNPFTRLAHFEFNLEGAGITLQPGYSYVIFSVLSEFPIPDRVPGEGLGPLNQAEESIYTSAVLDGQPFQFHQAFPVFDPDQNINQLATSRLIPVTPEPATGLIGVLLGVSLVIRRKRLT